MDQKKCFRVFFWPPPGKILKYWIRNPCYNAKFLKLEISISDPKIGPNSYFWSRISSKINRKWYRSDGNLLLVPDSSLGRKLEIRIFWCLKSWVKARFLIQSWAGKHGSWGGMTKKMKISKGICFKFHPSNFYEDCFSELEDMKSSRSNFFFAKKKFSVARLWNCSLKGEFNLLLRIWVFFYQDISATIWS